MKECPREKGQSDILLLDALYVEGALSRKKEATPIAETPGNKSIL